MINDLFERLNASKTAYHAVAVAEKQLAAHGFIKLEESQKWQLQTGKSYYVIRDGSALIAFTLSGGEYSFSITASHTDSPCLKVKLNAENPSAGCVRLNVERYGGGLNYTWFDIPLKIAGRVVAEKNGKVFSQLVELDNTFVIPSVAIHFNRQANDGLKFNPQTDMQVLSDIGIETDGLKNAIAQKVDGNVVDYDLFVVCGQNAFTLGFSNGLACAPRVDNLSSVFASIDAITECAPKNIPVIYLADNEEVGSRTKQGAGSTFLTDVLGRINTALNKTDEDLRVAISKSMMVSCDNAHATHPNHPELSDPTNKVTLGGGIVIKHHANQNYTTDAFSSAIFKVILNASGVKYQDFFMRSDLPCGGTLGAISSSQLSVRSVDIGMAQLAMHSTAETFAVSDYDAMVRGIKAFFSADISVEGYNAVNVK